jgi:hypothetical protein
MYLNTAKNAFECFKADYSVPASFSVADGLVIWCQMDVWLPNILLNPLTSSPVQPLFISPYLPNLLLIKSKGDSMPITWK